MIEDQVDALSRAITTHPEKITGLFLLLTVVMASGLSNIQTSTGTSDFTEGIEAQQALESVQDEFNPSFSTGSSSTQLIKSSQDALSKRSLIDMLETEKKILDSGIPANSATSPADIVASAINPNASTKRQKIVALESVTDSRIDAVISRLSDNPGFTGLVSDDFNSQDASASLILGTVSHPVESSSMQGPSGGGGDEVEEIQQRISDSTSGVTVFGNGILGSENQQVIGDSLLIVVPAASIFIVFFLIYAYRDYLDLSLGVLSLVMTIIWTFGFMGLAGIPFSQMLIAVPPLLLAVGIDFGIHAINRFKEENQKSPRIESMRRSLDQLLVAFFMVAGTTVIGFLSNTTSALPPIQDFGVVAGIGITFTALIFGIFLPAAKLYAEELRERFGLPVFGQRPVGSEDSPLGKLLPEAAILGKAPYLSVLALLLIGGSVGVYGAGVDTTFSQEDFLPPEDIPDFIQDLPEPLAPGDYSSTATLNLLDERFGSQDSVTVYIEAPVRDPTVLEEVESRSGNLPSSFTGDRESIIDVMESVRERSPGFDQLVEQNDVDGDGIPDRNTQLVFERLLEVAPEASSYLSDDLRSIRVDYPVDPDYSQTETVNDAREFADRFRTSSIATGMVVVFKAVSDLIFSSAINALSISLVVSTVFLIAMYRLVFGKPWLAVANMFPVVLTLSFILGTMRYLGIPLNALTATVLSITIGLGVDYSVHLVDRFEDELSHGAEVFEALEISLRGTGGALTSSMLTTVSGIGVLVLAITPVLGQFGLITGISILYSYLASLVALPPALVVWQRLTS